MIQPMTMAAKTNKPAIDVVVFIMFPFFKKQ